MRGKAHCKECISSALRITPAYAGKRVSSIRLFVVFKDHPRLCGEKTLDTARSADLVGSPPPMRGKVL